MIDRYQLKSYQVIFEAVIRIDLTPKLFATHVGHMH